MQLNLEEDSSSSNDENEDEVGDLSNMIENARESRPYDFELSSNSKYKIISENNQAKNIIGSTLAQPSMIKLHNDICKKLSFGQAINHRINTNSSNNGG